jgi:hypothetical protein
MLECEKYPELEVPKIVDQTDDLIVPKGTKIRLSVDARGSPAPAYQWYASNQTVPGATSSAFEFKANRAGEYSVTASNSEGNVASNPIRVTLLPPKPTADEARTIEKPRFRSSELLRPDQDEWMHREIRQKDPFGKHLSFETEERSINLEAEMIRGQSEPVAYSVVARAYQRVETPWTVNRLGYWPEPTYWNPIKPQTGSLFVGNGTVVGHSAENPVELRLYVMNEDGGIAYEEFPAFARVLRFESLPTPTDRDFSSKWPPTPDDLTSIGNEGADIRLGVFSTKPFGGNSEPLIQVYGYWDGDPMVYHSVDFVYRSGEGTPQSSRIPTGSESVKRLFSISKDIYDEIDLLKVYIWTIEPGAPLR